MNTGRAIQSYLTATELKVFLLYLKLDRRPRSDLATALSRFFEFVSIVIVPLVEFLTIRSVGSYPETRQRENQEVMSLLAPTYFEALGMLDKRVPIPTLFSPVERYLE